MCSQQSFCESVRGHLANRRFHKQIDTDRIVYVAYTGTVVLTGKISFFYFLYVVFIALYLLKSQWAR